MRMSYFGDSTLDLREWMLENGIDIALTQKPEDHFGFNGDDGGMGCRNTP